MVLGVFQQEFQQDFEVQVLLPAQLQIYSTKTLLQADKHQVWWMGWKMAEARTVLAVKIATNMFATDEITSKLCTR